MWIRETQRKPAFACAGSLTLTRFCFCLCLCCVVSTLCVCGGQIGDTLEEFLEKNTDDQKLRQLMLSMGEAVRTIAYKVSQA